MQIEQTAIKPTDKRFHREVTLPITRQRQIERKKVRKIYRWAESESKSALNAIFDLAYHTVQKSQREKEIEIELYMQIDRYRYIDRQIVREQEIKIHTWEVGKEGRECDRIRPCPVLRE